MSVYAIVQDDVVVNIAEADDAFAQEQGWILLPEGATVGSTFDGTQWVAPAPVEPVLTTEQRLDNLVAALATASTLAQVRDAAANVKPRR